MWFILIILAALLCLVAKKYYDLEKNVVTKKSLNKSVEAFKSEILERLDEYSQAVNQQVDGEFEKSIDRKVDEKMQQILITLRKEADETGKSLRVFLAAEMSKARILQEMRMAHIDVGLDQIAEKTSHISAVIQRLGKIWERLAFWKRDKAHIEEDTKKDEAPSPLPEPQAPPTPPEQPS